MEDEGVAFHIGVTAERARNVDAGEHVVVDDRTMTTVEGVYALGDATGHGAFTHTVVNDAEIPLDAIRGGDRRLPDRITAYAMSTDPPLARVGMPERGARPGLPYGRTVGVADG